MNFPTRKGVRDAADQVASDTWRDRDAGPADPESGCRFFPVGSVAHARHCGAPVYRDDRCYAHDKDEGERVELPKDEAQRADEVRRLVVEQLEHDTTETGRERYGRSARVGHYADYEPTDDESLAAYYTDEQRAIQLALESFLNDTLDGEERVLFRWQFVSGWTDEKCAYMLNTKRKDVERRMKRALANLAARLIAAFPANVEEDNDE